VYTRENPTAAARALSGTHSAGMLLPTTLEKAAADAV
jgi:hypothetical protein